MLASQLCDHVCGRGHQTGKIAWKPRFAERQRPFKRNTCTASSRSATCASAHEILRGLACFIHARCVVQLQALPRTH